MTASHWFQIANPLAFSAWILLVVFPNSWICRVAVRSGGAAFVLALGYWAALIWTAVGGLPQGSGFGSLDSVRALFSSEYGLLAGWVHYLAFDLLVGISLHKELEFRSVVVRAPLLLLVFLLGPIGWSLSRLFVKSAFASRQDEGARK